MLLHLSQEMRPKPRITKEVERDHPHISMHVTHQNQHRPFAQNTTNAFGVATLEQSPLVL